MEDYLSEALKIVKAQASVRVMAEDELVAMVKTLATSIRNIATGDNLPETIQIDPATAQKSIKGKSVTCLECDKNFKMLTARHLSSHGLTPAEYKKKYGIKPKTSLIAKSLQRMRKQKMQDMKLWERRTKTPPKSPTESKTYLVDPEKRFNKVF